MTLLEIIQLIGYSTAAALHLWIGGLLVKRRRQVGAIERVLMVLALTLGVWHACNLVVALHAMLGSAGGGWLVFLRVVDTLAVSSITLIYSLLLHVHLHLWATARRRTLTLTERARVYLSYAPVLFLCYAVPRLWTGSYAPLFVKLSNLLLPFALWAAYVLCLVAVTDLLIAHLSSAASERRLMRTLAVCFVAIAALILCVYALGLGEGSAFEPYLKTFANLASLLPTALLAYHIYRYRYLELILKESLIVASFAAVVLVVYLYGIRTLGEWLTARYALRTGVVESILILLLALTAAPLRRWLDRRFRQFFEREAALYRDVVTRIGAHAGRYKHLPELLRFVELRAAAGLGLRRVRLVALDARQPPHASDNTRAGRADEAGGVLVGDGLDSGNGAEHGARAYAGAQVGGLMWRGGEREARGGVERLEAGGRIVEAARDEPAVAATLEDETVATVGAWEERVLALLSGAAWEPVEDEPLLRERGFQLAYPLRREEREVGLMLVDAAPDALTYDVRQMLGILAGQVAIAIDDCRLVEENVRLERRVAQGERLAALGQMAATVAHEIKNPLSAIKSIAQVMREDEYLRREYERDLNLIVGEADRLSRSVTQMLSFARRAPQAAEAPQRADELARAVVYLARTEAEARRVEIETEVEGAACELAGACASAVRDALSNLLLNGVQATAAGGRVRVSACAEGARLRFVVRDEGPGIAPEMRERIWEPFFTTKQRGTGLGLAIVRKRIEEVGGAARLCLAPDERGACFELVVPLNPTSA